MIPTFFGRATVVLGEHAHLHTIVAELRELLARLDGKGTNSESDSQRLVHELYDKLEKHFAAEESEGYFGTLVAESPALASTVEHLLSEHREFLVTVRRLLDLSASAKYRAEFAVTLSGFLARFEVHEHAENRLLQEFFLRDEGESG